jgi:hypothetical protein
MSFIIFIISISTLIGVIAGSIYFYLGFKNGNWFKGIQIYLLSIAIFFYVLGVSFQENSFFINLKRKSNYHYTMPGSNIWLNIKLNADDTYEIQVAQPIDGKWGLPKKGKTSEITQERFADTGEKYYCFYLEDYPFSGLRTKMYFRDAFSSTFIGLKEDYSLDDGSANNPWH